MDLPTRMVAPPQSRPAAPDSTLPGLGARLRQARQARGLSQERLAQPEFTKSYVSALEHGKARPSLKALELLARRLDIPVTALLATPAPDSAAPDLPALTADLRRRLADAAGLLAGHQAAAALRRLHAAEVPFATPEAALDPRLHYDLHLLRAQAYLHLGEPAPARLELAAALTLAADLADGEAAERARCLLGAALYHQELPRLALEEHLQGRQAIRAGVVQDPQLRLRIYHHLVADYRALGAAEPAPEIQHEAAALLDRADNLAQQAAAYEDLSRAARQADPDRARRYAEQARAIQETAQHLRVATEMHIALAALRSEQQQYAAAERLLERAQTLLAPTGDDGLRSTVAEQQATLSLARGHQDQAAAWAAESVRLGERAVKALPEGADALARRSTLGAAARALGVAGLVAEAQGQAAEADRRFRRALELLAPEPGEVGGAIELAYAELLAARGAHEQASAHFRAAFRLRHRPALR